MTFTRPTLKILIERVLADMSSRVVGVNGAVLRRSVLGVLGGIVSGASHELHGHLDYLARQIIIDTADGDYLERWSGIWGVPRKAASFAVGSVTFTGVPLAFVPAGTVLQRQDGAQFETTADGTVETSTVTIAVKAVDAGAAGNTIEGVSLSLVQPVSGIQSTAVTFTDGVTSGSDVESDDNLRDRLLGRIQEPPQGGSMPDYQKWALEVAGVTRAWVYPLEMGAGTVTVRFVRDNDDPIIPDAPEVAAVFDYIDARRPVTAELYVVAPVAVPLDMTIQLSANTAANQAAVTAEIADLLRREAEPNGTILISHLDEAISIAPGEFDHLIEIPAGNVTHTGGEMPVLGTITFGPIV